ncbi:MULTISPECIES: AI-2E family transporter [Flammeovirga]|uniref:AI-2E family transporter n=1 Tax=Flammeovirga agarivorans TaxID=2726742 RepID=A0A7X8XWB3_9BACT|nr:MULTISPECIES: AI-2E family transporter [Flammeovirga]NLR92086.1 AI-2E family transporter [Flammeovirga agarivorans]
MENSFNYKDISKGLLDALKKLVFIGIGLYMVYLLQSVLIYVFTSAVIALIAHPVKSFFKKKLNMSNTLAMFATITLFLILILGFLSSFIPLITQEARNLKLVELDSFEQNIMSTFNQINVALKEYGIDLSGLHLGEEIMKKLKNSPQIFNGILQGVGSFSMGLFSTIFISFFLIKESDSIITFFTSFVPQDSRTGFKSSLMKIKTLLSRYFIGLAIQCFLLFVMYMVTLLIIGVKNAAVIAFICAVLNIIPYVGPAISIIIMAILAMSEHLDMEFKTGILPELVKVFIGYFGVQFIDNNFSQPIIFSKSVNSHPLEIFLVIMVFGILFGVVGLIAAIPVYTVIKVILKEFYPENKFVKALTEGM